MRLNSAPSAAPSAARLLLSYGPSQPHGWPASTPDQVAGMTLGGHTAYEDFTYGGRPHRISLLGFVRPGDAPDPIYHDKPVDPEVAFTQTLSAAFGARYGFRYRGGSSSRRELIVQSYSVFYAGAGPSSPGATYGGDLYVVASTDDDPADTRHGSLRWIQVARATGSAAPGNHGSEVDNMGRANPFHMFGGRTSINGTPRLNFYYGATVPAMGGPALLSGRFLAEAFLVRDTKTKNEQSKDIVEVYGGLRYGWQVGAV